MNKQKDYVYLLQWGDYYRIETASGVGWDLLYAVHRIQTKNADALRCSLFDHFEDKHVEGPWFRLDDSDVALLKRIEYAEGALSEEGIAIIIQEKVRLDLTDSGSVV